MAIDSSSHCSTHRGPPRPRPTVAGPGVPRVEGAVLAQQQQAAPAPVPGLGLVTCSCSVHLDTTPHVGYHLDFTDFPYLGAEPVQGLVRLEGVEAGQPGPLHLDILQTGRLAAYTHTQLYTTQ